jgi:MFS transporter, DHA2 family, glioxin efflux transporter
LYLILSRIVELTAHLVTVSKRLPDVSRMTIISTGATDLGRVFTGDHLLAIRESYLDGLRAAWAMAIALAGLAVVTGLTFGFKRIEKPAQKGDAVSGVQKKTEEIASEV